MIARCSTVQRVGELLETLESKAKCVAVLLGTLCVDIPQLQRIAVPSSRVFVLPVALYPVLSRSLFVIDRACSAVHWQ